MTPSRDVLVTGATGYMGTRVIPTLVARGHRVRALTREASRGRVPAGAEPIVGNALDAASIATALRPEDTLLHLVGTAHPSPAKAKAFVDVYGAELLHECVQLHGGIGVTFEHDLHLFVRRATLNRGLWGTPADHRMRLASCMEQREAAA